MSDTLSQALFAPFRLFLQPGQRIFWVFLASSLVIAVGLFLLRPSQARPGLQQLLNPSAWRHRSSWLDVKLLFSKRVARVLWAGPLVGASYNLALVVVAALERLGPAPDTTAVDPLAIRMAYTAILFVCWDLSRYLLHRALHAWPALWELHKLHHSAEILTPLTLYRTHPIESALFQLRGVVVTGTLAGLFFFLFRGRALEFELVGINALGFLFNLAGANLRHSSVWLSFGPRWERWLISPAQHQLHHSADVAHHGKNYGTWLAVWDRWAQTLLVTDPTPPRLKFGLPDDVRNHDPRSLRSAWVAPVLASFRALVPPRPR